MHKVVFLSALCPDSYRDGALVPKNKSNTKPDSYRVTQYPKAVIFGDRDTGLVKSPAISMNRGSPAFLSLITDAEAVMPLLNK